MTLGDMIERIKERDPRQIVVLENAYGVFWIGQARFVFGAVSSEAWNGTKIVVREVRRDV